MPVLITGGAGYIGSHTVKYFQQKNEEVIVVDNLSNGHRQAADVRHFYEIDIRDEEKLEFVFKKHSVDSVIHFAASSLVGESMKKPYEYYHNNVYGTLCLLNAMNRSSVKRIVFSSTAAVYGEPENIPIIEPDKTEPTNVYGETKLAVEKILRRFDEAYGMKFTALRYFNAAGAYKDGSIGEDHDPETHLIPIVLSVPLQVRDSINIFGNDYDTEDGTCIRDYVHVMDLAQAHYLALKHLKKENQSDVFNLGTGQGFSVREILKSAERVTGQKIPFTIEARREGDPSILIASAQKAKTVLGWRPQFDDIDQIIASAWKWCGSDIKTYDK